MEILMYVSALQTMRSNMYYNITKKEKKKRFNLLLLAVASIANIDRYYVLKLSLCAPSSYRLT